MDVNAALANCTQAELAGRGIAVRFIQADLSQPGDLARLQAQLSACQAIDLLIHNAGIDAVCPFATTDLAAQQKVLDVNLAAPLQLTAAPLRSGKIAAGGSLVFISSLSRLVS